MQALRPEPLEQAGLSDALAELAARWSTTQTSARPARDSAAPRGPSPGVEVALFRVGAGGADQRRQARAAPQGRAHAVLHGRRGAAGRARRRRRLRRRRRGRDARLRPDRHAAPAGQASAARSRSSPRRATAPRSSVPCRSRRWPGRMIRLLIVDDHPVVRDGLRGMFAATRTSRWSARRPTAPRRSPCVGRLAPGRGPDGPADAGHGRRRPRSRGCAARHPGAGCSSSPPTTPTRDVLPAIEAGATGYLLKDAPRDELLRAVRARRARARRCCRRRWRPG